MAKVPAGIGWRIPMVPFDSVAFPTVGIRGLVVVELIRGLSPGAVGTSGVRVVIGARGDSPGVVKEIGANMERFAPGIMEMFGIEPIP